MRRLFPPANPADWLFGIALLGLALAVRLSLLVSSGWLLEGDDSLSTLMAVGIYDRGEHPIMLKNQTYAGAWEPWAMAASFHLFGISRVAAKLPVLVASVAFVGVTWLFAREVSGVRAARFAAVLAAVPPVYVLALGLKPWAPYIEVMVFGTLALWAAARLCFGVPARPTWWAAGAGAAGGVAFWLHPIAIFYLLPIAVMVLLRLRGRRLGLAVAGGIIGFVVGAMPVWIYNLRTGGATAAFIAAGSGGQSADRLAVFQAWWNADLPRALGLWNPWGSFPRVLAAAIAVCVAGAFAYALWRRKPELRPIDLVLLFMVSVPLLIVLSGFGGPALNPWGFDATGRYAPPLWGGAAVLLGALLARISCVNRFAGMLLTAALVGSNLIALVRTDPVLTFQSPYWTKLPVDHAPVLSLLRSEGVTHVWLNHWAAFPLMFDARAAGQPLIAYDWYDVQAGGIDRFPEYLPLVEQADRPAFILVTDEEQPELFRRLDEMGVKFEAKRSGPYVVVIPTSRRVHPGEVTPALDYRY